MALSLHNLDGLLEHWAEVLHAFRAPFQSMSSAQTDALRRFSVAKFPSGSQSSSTITHQFQYVSTAQTDVDFDTAFVTLPIGDAGSKAVYWIHPDQIVEITVLLLQYLKLLSSRNHSSDATPSPSDKASRKSSVSLTRHDSMPSMEPEVDTGLYILDDEQDFARKQSSSIITELQHPATISKAPVGRIRWTSKSEAVVVLKPVQKGASEAPCGYTACRFKRKHLGNFLEVQKPLRKLSSAFIEEGEGLEAVQRSTESVAQARSWLETNNNVKPLSVVASKRTRFLGLANDETRGQWAVLDQNICLSRGGLSQMSESEWGTSCRQYGSKFPYAVLQIRQEGPLQMDLIDLLDRTYLVRSINYHSGD